MKEYAQKISLSGWDIGRPKDLPLTGFSGTHDLRTLLPLNVKQRDVESQRHVDALVLVKMLCAENSILVLGAQTHESISEGFLRRIVCHEPQLRVVIDVGAHLVDLTNLQVAGKWLEILHEESQDVEAAVFCDEKHQIVVLDSDGKVQNLRLSPFAKKLEKCVVFLDEAHSRGTDLRLPPTYRAAITLGCRLTKDKLAQGTWSSTIKET
jgi:hypothetical protein